METLRRRRSYVHPYAPQFRCPGSASRPGRWMPHSACHASHPSPIGGRIGCAAGKGRTRNEMSHLDRGTCLEIASMDWAGVRRMITIIR